MVNDGCQSLGSVDPLSAGAAPWNLGVDCVNPNLGGVLTMYACPSPSPSAVLNAALMFPMSVSPSNTGTVFIWCVIRLLVTVVYLPQTRRCQLTFSRHLTQPALSRISQRGVEHVEAPSRIDQPRPSSLPVLSVGYGDDARRVREEKRRQAVRARSRRRQRRAGDARHAAQAKARARSQRRATGHEGKETVNSG